MTKNRFHYEARTNTSRDCCKGEVLPLPPAQGQTDDERLVVETLLPTCCQSRRDYIPLRLEWLGIRVVTQAIEAVARGIVAGYSIDLANSISEWLKALSHEIDRQILAKRIRASREAGDAQARQMAERRQAQRAEQRLSDALTEFIEGL